MTIRLSEFDTDKSSNTFPIEKIMQRIIDTAPAKSRVAWQFPGYVSIVLSNGREIAFGDSLESNTGYSWNCYELDGTNNIADSFNDLKDIDSIVNELWRQAAPLLEKGE
jgi:hypothetical protein